jgi:apolipoprotein N-acyltransferase
MATPAPTPSAPAPRARWSGIALTGMFLVVGAILFYLVYLAFPQGQHFYGLIWIGILALILAILCYLAESFSRDPSAQRSLAWGFFGMGFAVLFLTVGLAPSYGVSLGVWQLVGILFLVIALGVSIALIGWRLRALDTTARRETVREKWREQPAPSAFSYAAANSPSVPTTAPPPSAPASGSTPPRSP